MRKRQALTGCPKKRSDGSYLIKYYKLNKVKQKGAVKKLAFFYSPLGYF